MKSRITIEVDLDFGKPYIQVLCDTQSDDVRDKLVRAFRERLNYDSYWCRVRFNDLHAPGQKLFEIEPLTPSALHEEIIEMKKVVDKLGTPCPHG